ncbi:hypothetical protein RhiirB3_385676 [Rhizophagus irregularis]|nr:hypothetical protein RhiirB3_385676 [Rhizophagus irregularis]
MSEVFVKIDNEIDTEKIDVIDNDVIDKDKIGVIDKDNYHTGKPITEIEVSPNEKYLVTYSKEDRSIVGWNIDNKNEGQLKFEFSVNDVELDVNDRSQQLCISDDKKLAYIRYKYRLEKIKIFGVDEETKYNDFEKQCTQLRAFDLLMYLSYLRKYIDKDNN